MRADAHFPTTYATWITLQLDELGRGDQEAPERAMRELREHVMRRYYEPLCAYLSATSYRDIDAPSALVAGFFVDRLADAANLRSWRTSGMPLRRWLMNGLLLWVRTELRRRRTRERRDASVARAWVAPSAASPEAIFEREWARAIVGDACELVERELHDAGDSARWAMFARHVIDGRTYDEIALERGCAAAEARNATRVVRARVDRMLERQLAEEGVPLGEIAEEMRRIRAHFAGGGEGP
ncbi:MAG: hypothetical protein LW636_09030 [Planctomycetaceae bacterium]|nr:hypothetical protein [Planctomycetaceae bacterium]